MVVLCVRYSTGMYVAAMHRIRQEILASYIQNALARIDAGPELFYYRPASNNATTMQNMTCVRILSGSEE